MFKITAAQRKKIARVLGRWDIKDMYRITVSDVKYNAAFTHRDKLTDYFKSKNIEQLSFFKIYQNHRLFGYIAHGVHKDKTKKNGVLSLCTLMLDNFVVREISEEISDKWDKDRQIINLIKEYFSKEWFYDKPSKNWLRVYDKTPINNAQARSASIRLKERRYKKLLEKHEKLKKHCKEVSIKQRELNKEVNSNNYMYD